MDLHLALWPLSGLNSCEVFYNNPKCPGANLDVDSANGGLAGPETITIKSYQGNIHKLCLYNSTMSVYCIQTKLYEGRSRSFVHMSMEAIF